MEGDAILNQMGEVRDDEEEEGRRGMDGGVHAASLQAWEVHVGLGLFLRENYLTDLNRSFDG